jgi:hypothetical protein
LEENKSLFDHKLKLSGMKTFTLFRNLLFLSLTLIWTAVTNAQNSPVLCDGKFFVSYGSNNAANSTTSVAQLSFSGSNVTSSPFITSPSGIGYNALGINPIDGYMYGVRYPNGNNQPRLVKIGVGGTNVTDLGAISGTNNGEMAYAGCFDADGTYYFATDDNRMLKIVNPVTTKSASQVGSTNSTLADLYDIAINPVDGQMYGATSSTLYKINKANATLTTVGNFSGSNYFAGLFFTENGTLYGYRSDGKFYQINKTTAAVTLAGSGTSYTYADGCSCSFRVAHTLAAPLAVCPTTPNPNPEFDITVSVQNSSNTTQTGLTYELTIPSNRFSFIETPAVIAQRLYNQGLLPSNSASQVVISNSGVTPATVMNKIVINSFRTPFTYGDANGNNRSFTLKLKLVTTGAPYSSVTMQSKIKNLPAGIGSEDLSDDPSTGTPDDGTTISFCAISTLPVNLLSFTGSLQSNKVLLNWETANEVNFDHYEIERSADNSSNFSTIASVNAKAGSAATFNYQYADDIASQNSSVLYYRLKMVDKDNSFIYSNVVMIRRDQQRISGLSISPNPVVGHGVVNIRLQAESRKIAEIRVFDASGKVVLRQQNQLNAGTNSITLNQLNLNSGLYTIQVVAENEVLSSKLSVIR